MSGPRSEQPLPNDWYVITGAPSSGTSTTALELCDRGYHTVEEAARLYIDEGRRRGISIESMRADELGFQENIASLKSVIELTQDPETTTFFVRGMPDTTAYMRLGNYAMASWVEELVSASNYRSVFLLEPLAVYDDKDPVRIESQENAKRIGELLVGAYQEIGLEPIRVPALSVAERADFIIARIDDQNA
jgi:predicted ATPase